MEKPFSASIDIASRTISRTADQRNERQRFYDRMTIRGVPVYRDEEDADSKPSWRGDHTFSADAAKYSLMHYIEPEVAGEHPDWTSKQVREHAQKRFESRLRQDLSYERQESSHTESTLKWRMVETAPGKQELATDYGDGIVTLNQLWEHTKEYAESVGSPDAYNRSEHAAQLAMQEAFLADSATGFVSVLSHPDSIRYVQVWEKQDGEIVSRQLDLFKTTGRDFSAAEGKDFVDTLALRFGDTHVRRGTSDAENYAHFFVTDVQVREDLVRTVARIHTEEVFVAKPRLRLSDEPFMRSNALELLTEKSSLPIDRLGAYLSDSIDRKIHALSEKGRQEQKKLPQVRGAEKKQNQPAVRKNPEYRLRDTQNTPTEASLREVVQSVDPNRLSTGENPMREVLAEWVITRTILGHSQYFPVGAPAALFWFSTLREPTSTAPPQESEPVKLQREAAIHRPKKETLASRAVTVMSEFFSAVKKVIRHVESGRKNRSADHLGTHAKRTGEMPLADTRPGRIISVRESPPEKMGLKNIESLRASMHEPLPAGTEQFVVYLMEVMDHVSELVRALPESPGDLYAFAEKGLPTSESHAVAGNAAFGIFLWIILSPEIAQRRVEAKAVRAESPKEKKNPSESGGSSIWLLLAIIWHLTMIREMGLTSHGQSVTQPQVSKKKKKRNDAVVIGLPQSGVIFMAANMIE